MKAIVMDHCGGVDTLVYNEDYEVPQLTKSKQVQVKLSHASINPVDYKIRSGLFKPFLPSKLPCILGRDGCGQVTDIGNGVTRFKVGDKVIGMFEHGAYAQFLVADESDLAIRPDGLDDEHAAGLGLVGVTVYQMFQKSKPFAEALAKKTPGTLSNKAVLVIGASGGTGSIAVLLAKHYFGATVFGVCSSKNAEYVKELGADYVIDYKLEDYAKTIPKLLEKKEKPLIDLVFDCVGQDDNKSRTEELMDSHGTFVTINPGAAMQEHLTAGNIVKNVGSILWGKMKHAVSLGPELAIVSVRSDGEALSHLVSFLVEHDLAKKIRIDTKFPLQQVPEAHRLIEQGRTVGKIVISIPE
jgi:NADPH:quinone reductase-like Zn-dependent oxidoreductase